MVNSSESSEHVRRTAAPVRVVGVVASMVGPSPTASDLATWQGRRIEAVIIHVFDSDAHADRHR